MNIETRTADQLVAGICPASSVDGGKYTFGLVQIAMPMTRVTAADARKLAIKLLVTADVADQMKAEYAAAA